nr:TonB-dependent receptor plug domain-containing protein [uncultured Carboxylicivirga sp.]
MLRTNILFIILILCLPLSAQIGKHKLSTLIVDEKNQKPVPFASLQITNIDFGTYASNDGKTLPVNLTEGLYNIQVSCLGYNTAYTSVHLVSDTIIHFSLSANEININEVTVTATNNEGLTSGSKINRKAIEHIQASSFTDVLQLIPGGKSQSPDLSEVNSISLRQVGSDANTSLGAAFIIDGTPISNDANLLSPSMGSDTKISDRVNVNNGVDMRQIPTDQIESIEIVTGIPSVVHGDLTSGAVIINQRNGITPLSGRLKTDSWNKLLALERGIDLGENNGILNLNGDYLLFNNDPRNPYVGYQRFTFSTRYFNTLQLKNSTLTLKGNLSYTGSAEKDRNDPEVDDQPTDSYRSNYNRFSGNLSAEWNFDSFVKKLKYSSRTTISQNLLHRNKFISNGSILPAPISDEEGEHYGIYLPATYETTYEINDAPLNSFNQLTTNMVFNTNNVSHGIITGVEWRYDKNLGQGEIYDLERPMFPSFNGTFSSSSRPRDLSSIPSTQKLSFFFEDNISYNLGDHKLEAQFGLRATQLLNLEDSYVLSNKIHTEPRLNLRYSLPEININDNSLYIDIRGGVGQHVKLPTLNQLYPTPIYYDLVQMDYFSQNPDLRSLHLKTIIHDPTNYSLDAAKNFKWEAGLDIHFNGHRASVTYFDERMNNGYLGQNQFLPSLNYKKYNTDNLNPTEPPKVDDLPFEYNTVAALYNQVQNASEVHKQGIEYSIAPARFHALRTNLLISGAWFNTTYNNSLDRLFRPSSIINGQPFPYVGIYTWDNSNVERQRFNTNFQFDTQIKELGMVFTTLIECVWFETRKYSDHNGWPVAYMDVNGNIYPFTEADKTDAILKQFGDEKSEAYFNSRKEPFGANLNLRMTKKFADNYNLSVYVNNLLTHYPDYYNNLGSRVTRIATPYFGLELNIKL